MTWFEDDSFWRDFYEVIFPDDSFRGAAGMLDKLLTLAGVGFGTALDLGCGPARYAIPLAQRGFAVTAVDRSTWLLERARARAAEMGVDLELVQDDMRTFLRPSQFDLALCLSNSFGYFDDRADDRRVLRNMHESLRPGGHVVLDMMCVESLVRMLPDYVSDLSDGSLCIRRHRPLAHWTRQHNHWTLVRLDGTVQRFEFMVQIYAGHEIAGLLHEAGFQDARLYGDVDGRPFDGPVNRLVAATQKPG